MQPQYGQGAAPSHHPTPYAPPEVSQASGGSITSSLRQWRKKDYIEKQQSTESSATSANENPSHVARVAPHTYYPRLSTNDVCHYQHQYAEYSGPYKPPAPAPVKFSEIVENQQAQTIEHITPLIPKQKDKEYVDLCSVPPQPHLKQYQEQMSLKQPYHPDSAKQTYSDPTLHHQYISKESQMHPFLQKQPQMHQYMQKEPYQQYLPKYNIQSQYSQSYPSEPNNFLAHLNKINPRMAQSIINDTHLRDPQMSMYHPLDQNRSYPQPQRMYHTPSMHSNPTHAHRNIPQSYGYTQPYNYNIKSNTQPSDPYSRIHQYQHNVSKYLPEYKMNGPSEQPIPNISPQRVYSENIHMNYAPMPPKISPNYPHCGQLEYAQHYQHRRSQMQQEYYPHSAYKLPYVQNPQISPEGGVLDSRSHKSSLKQYLETWVEEDISGNLPDIIVSNNLNDVENMENLKGTMCVKGSDTQEQPLYVLDTTEIPNENLPHFLHLQQFEKLPDNIRGYYHSVPSGSRRIIIENNNLEVSPESCQVVRGNSAPIVSKIPEVFTENVSAVAVENENIVNQCSIENQRKVVGVTPQKTERIVENQTQNLENKVVQIHIIEDPEAATSGCDSSTDDSTMPQRNSPDISETVIIQSNMYQHHVIHPDTVTKLTTDNENCVSKKHIPQLEEEVRSNGEDSPKNMPVIDECIGGTSENEKESVISSQSTESYQNGTKKEHNEEVIHEDIQTNEVLTSSRRSSMSSIYKEMAHIHGESNATSKNNLQREKTEESKTYPRDSENTETVPCNLSADQKHSEDVRENCKSVNNTSKPKITQPTCADSHSNANNLDEINVAELNAKDEHSKLEIIHDNTINTKASVISNIKKEFTMCNSHVSENYDSSSITSPNCPTDLTHFTNTEIPTCTSKDKSELSKTESTTKIIKECVVNEYHETKDTVDIENENHRHVSKKLRTVKITNTSIVDESLPEKKSAIQEVHYKGEVKDVNSKTSSPTEFCKESTDCQGILETENNTTALFSKHKDVALPQYTKENDKKPESIDNVVKTILQIPNAKSKISAINCQSSNDKLVPIKDDFTDQLQEQAKSPNVTESNTTLDKIETNSSQNVSNNVLGSNQIANNNKDTLRSFSSATSFEHTSYFVEDVGRTCSSIIPKYKEKNEEVVVLASETVSDNEHINKTSSQKIEKSVKYEEKQLELTKSTYTPTFSTLNKPVTSNPAFPKNEEDMILTHTSDSENVLDANNYFQASRPLNLSMDKKHLKNDTKTFSGIKILENRVIKPSNFSNSQVGDVSISTDPCSINHITASKEISKPTNLSLPIENTRTQASAAKITNTSSTDADLIESDPTSRNKELLQSVNHNLIVENTIAPLDHSKMTETLKYKLHTEQHANTESAFSNGKISTITNPSLTVENLKIQVPISKITKSSNIKFHTEFVETSSSRILNSTDTALSVKNVTDKKAALTNSDYSSTKYNTRTKISSRSENVDTLKPPSSDISVEISKEQVSVSKMIHTLNSKLTSNKEATSESSKANLVKTKKKQTNISRKSDATNEQLYKERLTKLKSKLFNEERSKSTKLELTVEKLNEERNISKTTDASNDKLNKKIKSTLKNDKISKNEKVSKIADNLDNLNTKEQVEIKSTSSSNKVSEFCNPNFLLENTMEAMNISKLRDKSDSEELTKDNFLSDNSLFVPVANMKEKENISKLSCTLNYNCNIEPPKSIFKNAENSESPNFTVREENINKQTNISELTDASDAKFETELTETSEDIMPTLKCMINCNESLYADNTEWENASKSPDVNVCLGKVKRRRSSKSKNTFNKMEDPYEFLEETIPQKKLSKTSNRKRESACITANGRRKSRRLNKEYIEDVGDYEQLQTSKSLVTKENNTTEIRSLENSSENILLEDVPICQPENVDIINEIPFSQYAEEDIEATVCTEEVVETKSIKNIGIPQRETETLGNFEQVNSLEDTEEFVKQNRNPELEWHESEEDNLSLEEKETNIIESNQVANSQEENFDNNDTNVVYQINDNNVVLQIADELLEINVTAQNGRKVILVKTLSDAILMNNLNESFYQAFEDTSPPSQCEESKPEDQTLSEDETILSSNDNDIIITSDLQTASNTDITDETNLSLKEICADTDITTVGDDVCVYNEEIVSSSTEIETIPGDEKETSKSEIIPTDKEPLQRKYVTRKNSKKGKQVSWADENRILSKTKCLTDDSPQISDTVKSKLRSNVPECNSDKKSSIKDSLRNSPKTKAALKFVETFKVSKTKLKELKVPSRATDNLKMDQAEESDDLQGKTPAKPIRSRRQSTHQSSTTESEDISITNYNKNASKERRNNQDSLNSLHHNGKSESHNYNKNKVNDCQVRIEKMDIIHKTKEKTKKMESEKVSEITNKKDSQKIKETSVKLKNKNLPSKEVTITTKSSKSSYVPKRKSKTDKVDKQACSTVLQKIDNTKVQGDIKNQKQNATSEHIASKVLKGGSKKSEQEAIQLETTKLKSQKKSENKKTKTKFSEKQSKTHFSKDTIGKNVNSVEKEQSDPQENQISVQENSITSSTCQENEASVRERNNKLIQQITNDWDEDSDDVKTDNSNKRRLSLEEYNSRKRVNLVTEPGTTRFFDLKHDQWNDNDDDDDDDDESPILNVNFNNKTYSRNSNLSSSKTSITPNIQNFKQHVNTSVTNVAVTGNNKEPPLSSAIELHLPKINRSPKPIYNQEYLRNALVNDLQTVNAYTSSLIKDNQELMQRFLDQQRLTAAELQKVKTIIRYKRLAQHLSSIRINDIQPTPLRNKLDMANSSLLTNASLKSTTNLNICNIEKIQANQTVNASEKLYEVNQLHLLENIKTVHLKKTENVPEKRKRKRFRFLYSDDESETRNSSASSSVTAVSSESKLEKNICLKKARSDHSVPALEHKVMDYSVHQSNSQGQLTLVFKRSFKSDPNLQPFVKLERIAHIEHLATSMLY